MIALCSFWWLHFYIVDPQNELCALIFWSRRRSMRQGTLSGEWWSLCLPLLRAVIGCDMYHSTVLLVVSGSAMCASDGRPGIGWIPHIGVSSVWGSPGMPSLVKLFLTQRLFPQPRSYEESSERYPTNTKRRPQRKDFVHYWAGLKRNLTSEAKLNELYMILKVYSTCQHLTLNITPTKQHLPDKNQVIEEESLHLTSVW